MAFLAVGDRRVVRGANLGFLDTVVSSRRLAGGRSLSYEVEIVRELETDYLVVGAGASGMAFIDTLLAETDADVLDDDLLPTGRVRFLGMSEYRGGDGIAHHVVSRVDGAETMVRVRRSSR